VEVHLLDATYELFRAHFGRPAASDPQGRAIAATVGVLENAFAIVRGGATHLGCATDHVIRSWRNERYPFYKTEEGMPPELLAQFPRVEDALRSAGFVVWAMVEFEADDAMAAAAARYIDAPGVERAVILSPDKDMAQCIREDGRVIVYDRRKRAFMDADGVRAKFGVSPPSVPDWLALVGDSADGYPGLPGWGGKSASAVLARFEHLEAIPERASEWEVPLRNAPLLSATLRERWEEVLLYRELATLRTDAPIPESIDTLAWQGVPRADFERTMADLGAPDLRWRVPRWADEAKAGS
jgi:5'-3' exonuclease